MLLPARKVSLPPLRMRSLASGRLSCDRRMLALLSSPRRWVPELMRSVMRGVVCTVGAGRSFFSFVLLPG